MARKKCDMQALRARRALIWYDSAAASMARLLDALDGSSPGLRAVELRHLCEGYDADLEVMSCYQSGLHELGERLPAGPWDI